MTAYVAPVLSEPQLRALAAAVEGRADLLALQAADERRGGLDRRRLHAERRALLAARTQLTVAAWTLQNAGGLLEETTDAST